MKRGHDVTRRGLLGGGFFGLGLGVGASLIVPAGAGLAEAAPPPRRGAWLGVSLQRGPAGGVLVEDVFPRSPAARANLKSGDMVVRAAGEALDSPRDLIRVVQAHRAGDRLPLRIRRGGREHDVTVSLAAHPGKDELLRALHVGRPAPDLRGVTSVQGRVPPSMKELRGQVVLVEFFAGWCAGCRAMAPQLRAWHGEHGEAGLTMIGLTGDGVAETQKVVDAWKLPYAVGSDEGRAAHREYKVNGIPALFVVDRTGVVREATVGYEPRQVARTGALLEKLLER